MGWKGDLVDIPLRVARRFVPSLPQPPTDPTSIFVLRNNDIGDLLTTTPLFDALRRKFPTSRIVAGVGAWNVETLRENPHLSDVIVVNAPWTNKYVSGQRTRDVVRYIWKSDEARKLAEERFQIGIDIVGSHVGAALLMRAGIPYRLGVRGYRGGHVAMQQYVPYSDQEHVSRLALRFAELLGVTDLPPARPQIFLSPEETHFGETRWATGKRRVLIGPGAGIPEKIWPLESYARLLPLLAPLGAMDVVIVGSKQEREAGDFLLRSAPPGARNLAGQLSLRETFATVAASDLVLCSPSMLMHVSAAFSRPNAVLMGTRFPSARQHQEEWGYDTCRSLGPDTDHPGLATPEEALAAVNELLGAAC